MRLSKPEPEPLLQPDLNLSGNVAPKRLGDLWQPHHHLHQQDNRASETKVSRVHGQQRADIIAHQGVLTKYLRSEQALSSGPRGLQRLREGYCHCEHLLWRTNCIW